MVYYRISDLNFLECYAIFKYIFQPYDGKVIRSWNCPNSKGRKITAPGIFSEEEQEFVFVQNKRTLRTLKLHNFDESETFTVEDILFLSPDNLNE